MRIVFQVGQMGFGGTERVVLSLARHCIANGDEVFVFVNSSKGSLRYYRRLLFSRMSTGARARFENRYMHGLARVNEAREFLGDRLVLGDGFKDFLALTVRAQPDAIHFNRGDAIDFYTHGSLKCIPARLYETSIFGKDSVPEYLGLIRKFVFISHWLRSKARWAPTDRSEVLYNPVATPLLGGREMLRKLGIPEGSFVVGRLSRPDLDDGEFFLATCASLLEALPSAHVVWLGAPSFIGRGALPRLHLLPATSDSNAIEDFYASIDVLLHYRDGGETFGMVVAEAMFRGVPVVSHRSDEDNAQVELLTRYGRAGMVLERPNPEAYTAAISHLHSNPDERVGLGATGRLIARSHFEEDLVCSRYRHLFQT